MPDTAAPPDELQAPDAPARSASPLGDIAAQIGRTIPEWQAAKQRQVDVAKEAAAAQQPGIESAKTSLADLMTFVGERPVPQAPPMPAPPSVGLRQFLAPVDGEAPEVSIGKLLHAVGLFATGATGLARGDATAALASMKGALEGWQAGDAVRADRAFKDWQAKTDTMTKAHEREVADYNRIIEAKKLSVSQKIEMLKLVALEHDNTKAVAALQAGNLDQFLTLLTQQQMHLDTVETNRARLAESKSRADQAHEDRLLAIRVRQSEADERRRERKEQDADVLASYTPEVLRTLGQKWIAGEPMNSLVVGRSAQLVRGKIVEAGIAWAKENGIPLNTLPQLRIEISAAKTALTDTRKRKSVSIAQQGVVDKHLDLLLEYSAAVPRSEMPAVNGAIVKGQRDFQGSPAAAKYVAMAYEVAMEYAKLMVGTAQGDEASRAEARNLVSSALTHDQLKGIAEAMRAAAVRRVASWEDAEQSNLDVLNRAFAAPSAKRQEPEKPATGEKAASDPLGIRR